MRALFLALCSVTFLFTGCGYVGPVLPPSPRIPDAINNLNVVERGDEIVITFSTPPRTTDLLPIEEFSNVDLRVGPSVEPFDQAKWEASARAYAVPHQYVGGDEEEPRSLPVTRSIPVSEWQGKKVDVLVRTSVRKRDHFSAWSNRITLDVLPPLASPALKVEATAAGYKLTWTADSRANKFQILRQAQGEKAPSVVGISDKTEYVDGTAQWDKTYAYNVIAQTGMAESLPSPAVSMNKPDTFAPAVPIGLVALAGSDSVELSWKRNEELDFKNYVLLRSVDSGPFRQVGGPLNLPSYTDRDVQHGKRYRYQLSAVDIKGNGSENSTPAEVSY